MGLARPSVRTLRALAIALLVANVGIVVSGGAVRLTGSGLGCPTWPRCTQDSFIPHGALGVHGAIEFGNRLMTFVLVAIAVLTWLAAVRSRAHRGAGRRTVAWLAFLIGMGIPLQAVIGGVAVWTELNPWVVQLHFMVSTTLIALCVLLIRRVREADEPARATVPAPIPALAWVTFAAAVVVIYLGTIVTGSGPHAGDADVERNGLDPALVSQIHAHAVFCLLGLTIATLFAFRAVGAPRRANRAIAALLTVELAQATIGLVQYAMGLPILVVGLHLLGAALTVVCATWVLLGVRQRRLLDLDQASFSATLHRKSAPTSAASPAHTLG